MTEPQTQLTTTPPTPELPASQTSTTGRGLCVAALIIGLFSVLGAFVPFVDYVTILAAMVGIALGIVGLTGTAARRGFAIAGIILSGVGLALSAVTAIVFTALALGASHAIEHSLGVPEKEHTLIYSVTGDSPEADISYTTDITGSMGLSVAPEEPLPFTRTLHGSLGDKELASDVLSLDASGVMPGSTITCTITLDGKTVSTKTSTGEFPSVSCER
jgi:hypothetical protein